MFKVKEKMDLVLCNNILMKKGEEMVAAARVRVKKELSLRFGCFLILSAFEQ